MKENLPAALNFIFADEGGFLASDGEPGGGSNMGVSLTAFIIWRHSLMQPTPTLDDLKALTRDEAVKIYTANYANPVGFNVLPAGVDYAALDAAVNEGVASALALLKVTSSIDDKMKRIQMISNIRLLVKKLHPSWGKYGNGWTARIGVRVIQRANAMIH